MFLALFFGGLVCCICGLVRHKDAETGLILLPLLTLSFLGIPAMKVPRAGYVLMPLCLYVIAYGMWVLRNTIAQISPQGRKHSWIAGITLSVVLSLPLYNTWKAYQQALLEASGRKESINLTRIAPREWFMKHVPPKTWVAIFIGSDWADPPIFDIGYDFFPTLLQFPYLDTAQMGRFLPPRQDTLPQMTDVIVLNNFHQAICPEFMRRLGHEKLAIEWERFFDEWPRSYSHFPV